MDNTWLKLYRKSIGSRVFQNEGLWKVWTWCLMRANHKKQWVPVKVGRTITEVKVLPGQFVFGRHTAARELNMSPSTVWKRVLKLSSETFQNLNIKSDSNYSIITIINWTSYQTENNCGDIKGDSRGTAGEQPGDTDKNDKNEKNKRRGYPPTPQTVDKNTDGTLLYEQYLKLINPESKSRQRAIANIRHYLKHNSFEDLHASIANYQDQITRKGTGRRYRKDPANFFGKRDPSFVDFVPGVYEPPQAAPEGNGKYSAKTARTIENLKNWRPPNEG